MKLFMLVLALCALHTSWAGDEKQIKLEDIERDTLIGETDRVEPEQKELSQQQSTQHIQLSYSNDPQDIFVTPMPRYGVKDSPADLRSQLYHLPKVHEADSTYTVPAKQTLIQPIIGGGQPIQPILGPQPQYIYIQSHQSHQPYMPQAHAYVMVPYASHYTPQQHPIHLQHHHHHPVLPQPQMPTPAPTIYTYSHGPTSSPHQSYQADPSHQSYQAIKSLEYSIPSNVTPLQTSVDYKHSATIVPKKTLPSIHTTSFQQFYSPGLEYHYTETVPITKLSPQTSYSYQHAPTHNFHTNYVSQTPSYSYYHSAPSSLTSSYNKHQSSGLLESYVPSLVTYARQQPPQQYKAYYPTQYQQQSTHQYSASSQVPQQQLFTPAQSSHYASYPSPQAYNTIQYSVPLPPYDHSKRSTSKATATASLSVKAPKAT